MPSLGSWWDCSTRPIEAIAVAPASTSASSSAGIVGPTGNCLKRCTTAISASAPTSAERGRPSAAAVEGCAAWWPRPFAAALHTLGGEGCRSHRLGRPRSIETDSALGGWGDPTNRN